METDSKERKEIEEFITKHERAHFLQSPEWAKVKLEWKHEEIILHDENGKINAYLSVLLRKVPVLNRYIMYAPRGPICDIYNEKIIKELADEIRKIGGSGWIHGCIIDIDYYNHVYVNPVDMTVRSYWASDIVNKLVYPTVPALLKNECPELYANYLKLIEGEKSNPLAVKQTKNEVSLLPQEYLETDIYKASREIKKMQKLNSNVLTTWYDIVPERNELPCKKLVSNKE